VPDTEPHTDPLRPALWFRVLLPGGALGPGKIALLRLIGETGSVSAAARRLGMSHARSVKLVAELNAIGAEPMVATRAGGETGGGATLTACGRRVLDAYDALDDTVRAAAAPLVARLTDAARGG